MKLRFVRRMSGSLAAGVLTTALIALPSGASAAPTSPAEQAQAQIQFRENPGTIAPAIKVKPPANPGEVCNTNQRTVIFKNQFNGEVLYEVEGGTPMRIESYAGPYEYYGHAQGKANGYFLRYTINQSSCHKT